MSWDDDEPKCFAKVERAHIGSHPVDVWYACTFSTRYLEHILIKIRADDIHALLREPKRDAACPTRDFQNGLSALFGFTREFTIEINFPIPIWNGEVVEF